MSIRAPDDHCSPGSLHHVELWVPDLVRALAEWGWLLGELGYAEFQRWPDGRSWKLGATYLVVEQSSALTASTHQRTRPGLNHLAFHAGDAARVDDAGGPAHYAAYLANSDGYEVELVATVGTQP